MYAVNDSYKLLYNNLWVVNESRISKLNPNYIVPVRVVDSGVALKEQSLVALSEVKKVVQNDVKGMDSGFVSKQQRIIAQNEVRELKQQNVIAQNEVELITDWDVLVDKVNNCKLCSLCDGRTNVVIERGSRQAPWMFVGEGPGVDEDKAGRPFVGKSGQLLDKMIAAMKLDKERDVYVCNVVKCRPPYNRNPEENEIAMCKNYLLSQIELVKPKVIIALGRFASQTLLESSVAIGKLRSRVHKFNKIPLIVTYHPAYLLRNPDAKKEAWDDLQLALKING
jgi:DNA polymerase